jgi:hypothetical protein
MKKFTIFCVIFTLIHFIGCSKVQIWTSSPVIQTVSNDYFETEFEPLLKPNEKFFNTFRLFVKNKTNRELTIDWGSSRYLLDGKNAGGFIFEGLTADNVKTPPPDIVPAAGTLSKVIFPLSLTGWETLGSNELQPGQSGFTQGILPEGENGILLVVEQNGKKIREEITIKIEVTELSN